jgi:hypothetical protein
MRLAKYILPTLAAVTLCSGAVAANKSYRCTDDAGLVLLTSDVGASRICKLLSTAAKKCTGQPCPIKISKDQDGRLYILGTVNGTPVRYPIDSSASAVTVCIRDHCKAQ